MRTRPMPRAFSLVELLVVLTITAVLITLLLPSLMQAKRQATSLRCMVNARTITQANLTYAGDHKGRLTTTLIYTNPVPTGWVSTAPNAYWFQPEYSNVATSVQGEGLLYQAGYLKTWEVFYCPGRSNAATDTYARNYTGNVACWKTFPNGGWIRNSYVVATSNIKCDIANTVISDIGKYHRMDITDPGKILTFEVNWADGTRMGATQHQHGQGYNYAFFDNSARFVKDPTNKLETSFDINYGGMAFNVGFNDANSTQIVYYMMTTQLGWSDAKYKQYMPQ